MANNLDNSSGEDGGDDPRGQGNREQITSQLNKGQFKVAVQLTSRCLLLSVAILCSRLKYSTYHVECQFSMRRVSFC